MSERERALRNIMSRDFAVIETALYLDSHPDDQAAIEYYKNAIEQRDRNTKEYEQKYGPLTYNLSAVCGDRWKWTETPWPWEIES